MSLCDVPEEEELEEEAWLCVGAAAVVEGVSAWVVVGTMLVVAAWACVCTNTVVELLVLRGVLVVEVVVESAAGVTDGVSGENEIASGFTDGVTMAEDGSCVDDAMVEELDLARQDLRVIFPLGLRMFSSSLMLRERGCFL